MTGPMDETAAQHRQFVNRGRAVFVLIAALVALQGLRVWLSQSADTNLVLAGAYVPAAFARFLDPDGVLRAAGELVSQDRATTDDIVLLLGPTGLRWWTPITYAFLHGGWTHVLVNSVWLAAFGSAVARRFGIVRFALFFVVTAIAGAAAHSVTHFRDFAPLVGASASISGMMAAAARFAFAPGAPLGPGAVRGELAGYLGPTLPLRYIFRERRVATFLIVWFAANLIFGAFVTPAGVADASIAWEAHIGGFLAGLLLFPLFDPVRHTWPASPEVPTADV